MNSGMSKSRLKLYKKEKLCSTVAIGQLFDSSGANPSNESAIVYPLRAVWRSNPRRSSDAPVQFLISVPKKRIRGAVGRVVMRRRIREAFRLNKGAYVGLCGIKVDVAFIYVANELMPYTTVEAAMNRILSKISKWSSSIGDVSGQNENSVYVK